jgi:hypothetical protein
MSEGRRSREHRGQFGSLFTEAQKRCEVAERTLEFRFERLAETPGSTPGGPTKQVTRRGGESDDRHPFPFNDFLPSCEMNVAIVRREAAVPRQPALAPSVPLERP